jgi:transcriptional regulator with PAS, ATPase and Fis domain
VYTESPPDIPRFQLSVNRDWIMLRGRTLAQIEALAIRSSFARNKGVVMRIKRELEIARSTLYRKLDLLGLHKGRPPRHLRNADIARCVLNHRKAIAKELKIADSTLIRWLNKRAPFRHEEG